MQRTTSSYFYITSKKQKAKSKNLKIGFNLRSPTWRGENLQILSFCSTLKVKNFWGFHFCLSRWQCCCCCCCSSYYCYCCCCCEGWDWGWSEANPETWLSFFLDGPEWRMAILRASEWLSILFEVRSVESSPKLLSSFYSLRWFDATKLRSEINSV